LAMLEKCENPRDMSYLLNAIEKCQNGEFRCLAINELSDEALIERVNKHPDESHEEFLEDIDILKMNEESDMLCRYIHVGKEFMNSIERDKSSSSEIATPNTDDDTGSIDAKTDDTLNKDGYEYIKSTIPNLAIGFYYPGRYRDIEKDLADIRNSGIAAIISLYNPANEAERNFANMKIDGIIHYSYSLKDLENLKLALHDQIVRKMRVHLAKQESVLLYCCDGGSKARIIEAFYSALYKN